MTITDNFIKSGRRQFERSKVAFISITPGITSKYGRAQTYRVNLKMKGWIFTNKCLSPIEKKEDALRIAQEIATILGLQVWDETGRS